MSKRTILHAIETSGPGGAETVLLHLASRVDRDRFRSIALLPGRGWLSEQLEKAGVPVHFVESNGWYDLGVPRAMRRLIRQEGIDLIHSHLAGYNFHSCLAGSLTGRRTVVTYHGAAGLAQLDSWKTKIRLATVRHTADTVVAVCDYVSKLLLDAHFSPDKIVRIYNGINVEQFQVQAPERLRTEFRLPANATVVGCVANLRKTKGHAFLIPAARLVIDQLPDCHFFAIGDIDPDISRPLFELVEKLHLEDRFHFLGFRRDVPQLLGELDVFVIPSVSEGFPLVALEAMAAGRPVVSTRCGGPDEVVEDGVTGLMIPPGDPGAIARALMILLSNRQLAMGLAKRGRARVEAGFTIEKMVGEHELVYERLLGAA